MSIIEKITSNKKILLTIEIILAILLLPVITYLSHLFLMFLYNLGIYLGAFIRLLFNSLL